MDLCFLKRNEPYFHVSYAAKFKIVLARFEWIQFFEILFHVSFDFWDIALGKVVHLKIYFQKIKDIDFY